VARAPEQQVPMKVNLVEFLENLEAGQERAPLVVR
jgi:hypothetical protein